jgi:hypothetical protein
MKLKGDRRNCNNPASRIEPKKELLTTDDHGSRVGASLSPRPECRARVPMRAALR